MKPVHIALASIFGGAVVAVVTVLLTAEPERAPTRASARSRRIQQLEQEVEELRAEFAQLQRDIASGAVLKGTPDRSAPGATPGELDASDGGTVSSVSPALADLKPAEREQVLLFSSLARKFFAGKASKEETERFWKLARSGKNLEYAIASAKAEVEANPQSVEARMQLAEVNLAKLYTLPRGAERRLWAEQASEQYRAILELDENNWEARNAIATGYFHTPANLNKTADAIREFERLRQIQEAGAAETRQAPVYVNLSILYRRVGNEEKARAILEAGLRRHPQNAEILKTLAAWEK